MKRIPTSASLSHNKNKRGRRSKVSPRKGYDCTPFVEGDSCSADREEKEENGALPASIGEKKSVIYLSLEQKPRGPPGEGARLLEGVEADKQS